MSEPTQTTVTVTFVADASVPADALPTLNTGTLVSATWDVPLELGKLKPNAEPTIGKYTTSQDGGLEAVLVLVSGGIVRCNTDFDESGALYAQATRLGARSKYPVTATTDGNAATFTMGP